LQGGGICAAGAEWCMVCALALCNVAGFETGSLVAVHHAGVYIMKGELHHSLLAVIFIVINL